MNSFEHYIITRFNVKIPQVNVMGPDKRKLFGEPLGLDEKWLRHRFALFEQFCSPSVLQQTEKNFKWILLFDSNTPSFFKDKINEVCRSENQIVLFMNEWSLTRLREEIKKRLSPSTQYLMTTRLDNDDALCKDFVKIVQEVFPHRQGDVISFNTGFNLFRDKFYFVKYKPNPFLSLVEEVKDFKTVFHGEHRDIYFEGPTHDIVDPPGWLQVVHDYNLRNQVRAGARRVAAKKTLSHFKFNEGSPSHKENLLLLRLEQAKDWIRIGLKFVFRFSLRVFTFFVLRLRRMLIGFCPVYDNNGRRGTVRYLIQEDARLEVSWREARVGKGPSASLYVYNQEIFRFDCFGEKRGHYHVNLTQPCKAGREEYSRMFFFSQTVEEQIERSIYELRTNVGYYLQRDRSPKVRKFRLDPNKIEPVLEWMRDKMLEYNEKYRYDPKPQGTFPQ